jgi:hypothetical protein
MPHEGVPWQQGGAGIGMDAELMEIEEPARRIEPSLVASRFETAKRANQPAVHRERPSEGPKETRKSA